jgi:hypothetical protein
MVVVQMWDLVYIGDWLWCSANKCGGICEGCGGGGIWWTEFHLSKVYPGRASGRVESQINNSKQ